MEEGGLQGGRLMTIVQPGLETLLGASLGGQGSSFNDKSSHKLARWVRGDSGFIWLPLDPTRYKPMSPDCAPLRSRRVPPTGQICRSPEHGLASAMGWPVGHQALAGLTALLPALTATDMTVISTLCLQSH